MQMTSFEELGGYLYRQTNEAVQENYKNWTFVVLMQQVWGKY